MNKILKKKIPVKAPKMKGNAFWLAQGGCFAFRKEKGMSKTHSLAFLDAGVVSPLALELALAELLSSLFNNE